MRRVLFQYFPWGATEWTQAASLKNFLKAVVMEGVEALSCYNRASKSRNDAVRAACIEVYIAKPTGRFICVRLTFPKVNRVKLVYSDCYGEFLLI